MKTNTARIGGIALLTVLAALSCPVLASAGSRTNDSRTIDVEHATQFSVQSAVEGPQMQDQAGLMLRGVLSRLCEQQVQPMLVNMHRQIDVVETTADVSQRLCRCTLDASFGKPSMAPMVTRIMERRGDVATDNGIKSYFAARVASSMFSCLGSYLDGIAESMPDRQ